MQIAGAPRTLTIVGIVNITTDSFSDGGLYLPVQDAIRHALDLRAGGADIVELGAEPSSPDAEEVPAEVEIARLRPVLAALTAQGIPVSVDSRKPEVQQAVVAEGASMINDITGFPDPVGSFRSGIPGRLVVMHSVQRAPRADRRMTDPGDLMSSIFDFFDGRVAALTGAGVSRDRIVLDPGMGYFLGANPEASVTVLRHLPELRGRFDLPVMVSVSRKSFLRKLAGCAMDRSGPASLTAELFAASSGADYIRTHDAASLRDGLRILAALTSTEAP